MEVELDRFYACIEEDLGEILSLEVLCPGAFYLSARDRQTSLPVEYYIVETQTDSISAQAKAYGQPLSSHPEYLSFLLGGSESTGRAVKYEALLYRTRHNLPLPKGESLQETAVYGREEHPEYFGAFPAPTHTPFGEMVRYQQILPGVFALVTDTGEKAVSVCYPLWAGDLTDYTVTLGKQTEYDLSHDIHNTYGDLFFSEGTACLALFELSLTHQLKSDVVDLAALKNVVFRDFPEYVIHYNRREALGLNDGMGIILDLLEADGDRTERTEHLLSVIPSAGMDYLKI